MGYADFSATLFSSRFCRRQETAGMANHELACGRTEFLMPESLTQFLVLCNKLPPLFPFWLAGWPGGAEAGFARK
jgi:hypothetical protein